MAIIGLGTDIVEISRIEQSLLRSPGLIKRVLTVTEQQHFSKHTLASQPLASRYFAKRFAAKEAAAKALGTGIGRGVSFQHIEISNDQHGRPELKFNGFAAELATRLGVSHCWLSLSDEQAYAMATVILEGQP